MLQRRNADIAITNTIVRYKLLVQSWNGWGIWRRPSADGGEGDVLVISLTFYVSIYVLLTNNTYYTIYSS